MATPNAQSAQRAINLGTVYTQTGAGIHTTYQYSNPITGGAVGGWFRFTALSTTLVTTNITSVQIDVQVSKGGSAWQSIATSDDAAASPLTVGQSFAIGAAGTPQENSLFIPPGFQLVRVGIKATGGVGQTGESIAVDAQAYVA